MGKYQLDDKGKAQVLRFHEKNASALKDKKEDKTDLRAQFLEKLTRKSKKE